MPSPFPNTEPELPPAARVPKPTGAEIETPPEIARQGVPARLPSYSQPYMLRPLIWEGTPNIMPHEPGPLPEMLPAGAHARELTRLELLWLKITGRGFAPAALYRQWRPHFRPGTRSALLEIGRLRLAAVARDLWQRWAGVLLLLGIAFLTGVAIVYFAEGGR